MATALLRKVVDYLREIEETLVDAEAFFEALSLLSTISIAKVVCDFFAASQIYEIEEIVRKEKRV